MKKIVLIFLVIFVSASLFAQTDMKIRKTDNSVISISISEIDSIYYETSAFTCGDQVTDFDGNLYPTVEIGGQCWFAKALRVTHYPNGDEIPNVTDNTTWVNLEDNNTDDAYCFYENNSGTDYGILYTYAASIADDWTRDNTANQGVCPDGWHLPSDAEWTTLTDEVGGESIAGGKLKEAGTTHWYSPNTGATNESGFTALPGGYRWIDDGNFYNQGYGGAFWTATESSTWQAFDRYLYNNFENVSRVGAEKGYGFSVRCIQD